MADGEQARAGGADSLDERRSHACASGKACWKCVVHATKAVQSRRFTVRCGDGARPRPTRAHLAWTLESVWQLFGSDPLQPNSETVLLDSAVRWSTSA